ncbi:TIGR01459 family HAD-type hydrolase [Comamonas composti]|uniref:TIGR01459 family HAD-type hydrolase n=1 Tax=Comamonas composti TaxID=408558 RepID=UPI000418E73F|nr:TIGR01459 family HAD-type hydrolase [Comamonas composti]
MNPCHHTEGLRALADHYDGFVIDQWGVLHDGRTAYPGAIQGLQRLMALGKQIVILSNSGKRVAPNVQRLDSMGFIQGDSYTHLVTSGEAAWQSIKERSDAFYAALGPYCLLIGDCSDNLSAMQELAIERVDIPEAADFVLLSSAGEANMLAHTQALLERALALDLPLICTNPDMVRIVDSQLHPSAGVLARNYEQRGGSVRFVGKPYPDVYKICHDLLAKADVTRIAAIGDSLEHDINGGTRAGFATVLILGGIHRDCFEKASNASDRQQRLQALLTQGQGLYCPPNWTMPILRW